MLHPGTWPLGLGPGCLVKNTLLVMLRPGCFGGGGGIGLVSSVASSPGHLISLVGAFVHLRLSPHHLPPAIDLHTGVAKKGKMAIRKEEPDSW